jgi:RNA polymerase sigma-54 factor
MVSVLALNKLELRDMINTEMVENPVLEELEDSVPLLDDIERKEEERERPPAPEENTIAATEKKDPFEEIDFGSFFQEYLDPGYRSPGEMEDVERPSFENFLSKPSNLTDHLLWQLGAMPVSPQVREAAELIIGNLNEDGYLIASDDELMGVTPPSSPELDQQAQKNVVKEAAALGLAAAAEEEFARDDEVHPDRDSASVPEWNSLSELHEALELVRQFDPPGVACRDLRDCLLYQLRYHQHQLAIHKNGNGTTEQVLRDAIAIADQHLRALQMKQHREIGKAINRPVEAVQEAIEYIRTLDPRPGLRYNKVQARLIEPDVAFVKHGDEWLCLMNDEDVPQLRLNPAYKRLLNREGNDKDTRNYVKERYKSAIQLIKNIEQRRQTIMKVCYSIVARQQDFLEKGIDQLKPMMIKEVAEEIGVHPSTVSRAVANKYAHTPQGVFELRYFFSESVQGPEGGNTR